VGLHDDALHLLQGMSNEWVHMTELLRRYHAVQPSLPLLLSQLSAFDLVERRVIDDLSPLTQSEWRKTKKGLEYQRIFGSQPVISTDRDKTSTLVVTLPQNLRKGALANHFLSTSDCISSLLSSAKTSVHILCPYVDSSLSPLLQPRLGRVSIQIVTTPNQINGRSVPNHSLERIAQDPLVQVRYYRQMEYGVQLSQLHAKLILIDSRTAYVGSANLKETSLFHNVELGVTTSDSRVIGELMVVFSSVWDSAAPKEGLV